MKKILAATTVVLLFTVTTVFAAPTGSSIIKNTKHNLSKNSGNSYRGQTSDQICAFCHTPHKPKVNIPLWNRTETGLTGFTFYSSSQLSDQANHNASILPGSISAMCLSCHIGGTAPFTNTVKTTNIDYTGDSSVKPFGAAANLGVDLSNDHPVGFSYDTAQGQRGAGGNTGTALQATAYAQGKQIMFYTIGASTNRIECASCHKTHDDSFKPFLRITNEDSQLCRACHKN